MSNLSWLSLGEGEPFEDHLSEMVIKILVIIYSFCDETMFLYP